MDSGLSVLYQRVKCVWTVIQEFRSGGGLRGVFAAHFRGPSIKVVNVNFPEYIANRFPGLTLGAALFYSWPVGIRFDLNDRFNRETDFAGIESRATSIYYGAFQRQDTVIAVSLKEPDRAMTPIRLRHSHGLFDFSAKHLPNPIAQAGTVSLETEDGQVTIEWGALPTPMDVGAIFRAIANVDFARLPKITDRVYFVNMSRDIILHMYDDRGLDVIATNRTSLLGLYHSHNAWILDHDRERIDVIFSGK